MEQIATHLVAFVLGGIFWPFAMNQVQKLFKKND